VRRRPTPFTVSRQLFEEYNELRHEWVVEPEKYVLLIGTSSRDLPVAVEVDVQGENPYAGMEIANPLDLYSQQ
jgi:hypothetical protein